LMTGTTKKTKGGITGETESVQSKARQNGTTFAGKGEGGACIYKGRQENKKGGCEEDKRRKEIDKRKKGLAKRRERGKKMPSWNNSLLNPKVCTGRGH